MLSNISTSDSIVLYWDLPENYEKDNFYTISENGTTLAKTEKCHLEIDGLLPDTDYTYHIYMEDGKGIKTDIGEINCKTLKEKKKIDITKEPYFAVGDGKTLNTQAIQRAIDDCGENECVYVPGGDFMTGSLFLHSNMELYIEKGGILHGTDAVKDYEPKIMSRFEGAEMMTYAALLNIGELDRKRIYETCCNVRIYGDGTICGGGRTLADNVVETEKILMNDYQNDKTILGRVRPRLVNISCAKNIVIKGVTLMNGASWNVHMIYSKDIVTCLSVFRSENVWNGDGWDPDSSKNCTLFGCEFFTGDDSVAVKSGKNPEGNIINIPCENIRIFDCVSRLGHGIAIGSEMSGGVKDVKIWNCDIENSIHGIHIKATEKRGGYIKNIDVRYVRTSRIQIHSVGYNDDGESSDRAPLFSDCYFENIQILGQRVRHDGVLAACDAVTIEGFEKPGHFVKNIKFKNIELVSGVDNRSQTLSLQRCEGISFENIYCK